MATYTQAHRPISITTPIYPDALLLEKFTGTEAVSELFHFELELLATVATITFERLLCQTVTVTLTQFGKSRYINGIISRLSQRGKVRSAQGDATFFRYRAELVPTFWLWTKKVRCRIFQNLSIPDILKQVLHGLDVKYLLEGTFTARNYCVQYLESDFAFASRLMEEAGIRYEFQHTASGHTLVLTDVGPRPAPVPPNVVLFDDVEGGVRDDVRITAWEKTQEVRASVYTLRDHCFELASALPNGAPGDGGLAHVKQVVETKRTLEDGTFQVGSVTHPNRTSGDHRLEIFDYPGGFAKRFDGIGPSGDEQPEQLRKLYEERDQTVRARLREEFGQNLVVRGSSNGGQFVPGLAFTLKGHYNGDGPYIVTRVEHTASLEGAYTSGEAGTPLYENEFACSPQSLDIRPVRVTPQPKIEGTQTATVVGLAGEEVTTDKYGRIKVQFHWDRDGKFNADSSCWVRVAQSWAGKGYGSLYVPRIGQEVVVSFLDGDPDRPLVVGCVYNAENTPPFSLPDERATSGVKTRTLRSGAHGHGNELYFVDVNGHERVNLEARKDLHVEVEHDRHVKVKNDSHEAVDHDRHAQVGKDSHETVGKDSHYSVVNDYHVKVGNHYHLKIGGKDVHLDGHPDGGHAEHKHAPGFLGGLGFIEEASQKVYKSWGIHSEVVLGWTSEWVGGASSAFVVGGETTVLLGAAEIGLKALVAEVEVKVIPGGILEFCYARKRKEIHKGDHEHLVTEEGLHHALGGHTLNAVTNIDMYALQRVHMMTVTGIDLYSAGTIDIDSPTSVKVTAGLPTFGIDIKPNEMIIGDLARVGAYIQITPTGISLWVGTTMLDLTLDAIGMGVNNLIQMSAGGRTFQGTLAGWNQT